MKKRNLVLLSTFAIIGTGLSVVSCYRNPDGEKQDDKKKLTGIALNKTSAKMDLDATLQLNVTATPADAELGALVWRSSNEQIATVTNGLVRSRNVGKATITVSTSDGKFSATCEITVEVELDPTVKVEEIVIDDTSKDKTIVIGESFTIGYSLLPLKAGNRQVEFASSSDVVTVDESGKVVGAEVGEATITITSKGNPDVSATINVKVVYEALDVTNLVDPACYAEYLLKTGSLDKVENIQTAGADGDHSSYYENEEGKRDLYAVGTANNFKFPIQVASTDEDLNPVTYDNPYLTLSLELFNEETNQYDELSNDVAATYLTSLGKSEYKFSEEAAGKTFRVTFTIDETKYSSVTGEEENKSKSYEFSVVDAYNVYTLDELTLFDNRSVSNPGRDYWKQIKENAGLNDYKNVKGIVLHNDLAVLDEWLPEALKYSEDEINSYVENYEEDFNGWYAQYNEFNKDYKFESPEAAKKALIGSLKDYNGLLSRNTSENDEFTFLGNYFTIDFKDVPKIYSFNDNIENHKMNENADAWKDGSHGELFSFNTDHVSIAEGDYAGMNTFGGTQTIRNITIKGNGEKSNDVSNMGGLMGFKIEGTTYKATNVNISNTFIAYLTQITDGNLEDAEKYGVSSQNTFATIDRSKCFDSYNSIFYIYCDENTKVTNSLLTGAGGAIFLLDDHFSKERSTLTGGYPTVETENVYFENWVTGAESWFNVHNATSLVSQYLAAIGSPIGFYGKNAEHFKNEGGKTITKKDDKNQLLVNMIAIEICGADPLGHVKAIQGSDILRGGVTIKSGTNDQYKLDMEGLDPAKGGRLAGVANIMTTLNQPGVIYDNSKDGAASVLFTEDGSNAIYPTTSQIFAQDTNDEYKAKAQYINQTMGANMFEVEKNVYESTASEIAKRLALADFTSVYLQPSTAHYHLGVLLGTTPYNF